MAGRPGVLLTGGTGFLGTLIARRLMDEDVEVIVLVRSRSREEAANRLRRAWWDWPELADQVEKRVVPIPGDICLDGLGLKPEDQSLIIKRSDIIINAAADLDLNKDVDALRKTNVHGVENLIGLAREIHEDHGLFRFSHISTAYVCGQTKGTISEDAIGSDFSSNYERSKAEGETVVRKSGLPFSMFRPAMIVGDSKTGWIRTFNTLYYPLRLYLTGRLRTMPIEPDAKVNLVPGDVAADAMVRITIDHRGEGRTAHLIPPHERLPSVKDLVDFTREWAKRELSVDLPKARFLRLPDTMRNALIVSSGKRAAAKGSEGDMRPLMSYLEQGQVFRRDTMDDILGKAVFEWKPMMDKALAFGSRYGFMHRSERTVHEQVLFRLGRTRRKVRLANVIDGKRVESDAVEVKENIQRLAKALLATGIEKGDRVAVVGLNSVRYLIIESAIGLAGAVSVPLYYTSPASEIVEIIGDCKAKMLFIGCSAFEKLPSMLPDVKCISFLREGSIDGAMEWADILAKGDRDIDMPMVEFDDIATIRYTSGTTGRPRGVVFDHGNLRWIAEAIASLPPWTARNSDISYLSFLPMNHVVEGILGTYAPYYAPAALDLNFLEEFRQLRPALKEVRPNVFFSVPRFYEKLWDAFEGSSLFKLYSDDSNGKSSWLKLRMGRMMLKRAGLDRCSQLIVGSAPCDDGLLLKLRSLGIEVHNAYGLTEAPLITLNQVGRNRIGTVGEPLPDTQVSISPEGEILVSGKQLMRGYYPLSERMLGPLRTGDLGRITADGSLAIEGRIKEVMINSYGKNIMPAKVESALRQIPGVVEAMLIVDGRPFGTALLWVEPEYGGRPGSYWDEQMGKVGRQLSDPERPKAWAVLPYDLDIGKGEMTANMKLKRKVLMSRFSTVVASLYSDAPRSEGALHVGREARR
ncbi:MAG: long-chain-fatty-acid--CoA ligase [Methanomassiliicoccales archaeon PtaU1.Bin124]|nr:MAG: long-chain-fatty-acid--CoA ligase [Methanomassiliicoccales archaeon PtaU1.Bin124]